MLFFLLRFIGISLNVNMIQVFASFDFAQCHYNYMTYSLLYFLDCEALFVRINFFILFNVM